MIRSLDYDVGGFLREIDASVQVRLIVSSMSIDLKFKNFWDIFHLLPFYLLLLLFHEAIRLFAVKSS